MPKFPLFKTLIEQLRMPSVSVGEAASMTCEKCGSPMTEGSCDCDQMATEAEMTPPQEKERERLVKGMKKSAGDFEKRYPGRGKNVMYATATKRAMENRGTNLLSAPLDESEGLTDDEHAKLDKIIGLIDRGHPVMGISKQKLEQEHGDAWKSAAYGIVSQKLVDARPGGDPVEPEEDEAPLSDEGNELPQRPRAEARVLGKKKD